MPVQRNLALRIALLVAIVLLAAGVGAGWKWHATSTPQAGWTWGDDGAALYVAD
jgi:hypothetical protein